MVIWFDRYYLMVSFYCVIANYIHNLDPVLFELTDAIKLRWYGLAYLAAFVVGFYLLKKLGEKKLWVLPGEMSADFIAAAAFFGVFIGGRLGHVLIYENYDWVLNDPLMPLRVWEGGMASHGGILGLMIFTFVYCRMKKVSWTGLGDGLCVVAPLGLMFGRVANFINGEYYGKLSNSSFAVKFPEAFWNPDMVEQSRLTELTQAMVKYDPSLVEKIKFSQYPDGQVVLSDRLAWLERFREDEGLREVAGEFLEARHASQLYEAFFEGALLFAVLFFLRWKFPNMKHGVLTGLFFVLYALGRIFCEFYREPEIANIGPLTMGQFLSTFMIVIGVGFILWGVKNGSTAPIDRAEFDKRPKPQK